MKLGPGFDRDLIPSTAEAQWVSVDGQVVEMGLWFGALARPGIRRAALVLRGEHAHELTAEADSEDDETGPLGEYLYEPDGAVIRARLIGDLARRIGRQDARIRRIAYLTADEPVATPVRSRFPGAGDAALPGEATSARRSRSAGSGPSRSRSAASTSTPPRCASGSP